MRRADSCAARVLLVTLAASLVGCAARGGTGTAAPIDAVVTTTLSRDVVTASALSFRGTPYRAGGESPRGFDCSGFTSYIFGLHGLSLPRQTRAQYGVGAPVQPGQPPQPGDLVFFSTVARGPSHVGLALGNDRFIHAPSTRGVVRIERLSSRYWSRRYLGARDVLARDRAP